MDDQSEIYFDENQIEQIVGQIVESIKEDIDSIFDKQFAEIKEKLAAIKEKLDYISIVIFVKKNEHELARNILNEKSKKEQNSILEKMLQCIDNKVVGEFLTEQYSNVQQEGRIPYNNRELEERQYRSFKEDREKQLLRHISTQLYFAFKPYDAAKDEKKLVEIQTMYLDCNEKKNIFIVANNFSATKNFKEVVTKHNFEKLLTYSHILKTGDDEGKERSKRFALKLEKRVFGIEISPELTGRANEISVILREKNIFILELNYMENETELSEDTKQQLNKIFKEMSNCIFLVHIKNCSYKPYKLRHAEEFLCDIVEFAKQLYDSGQIHACIAGKKRPCMGCSGRMESTGISNYGKFPGLFWLHTIKTQSEEVVVNTANLLVEKPSHISLCKDNRKKVTDYDSGSDSDESEYEKIPMFK